MEPEEELRDQDGKEIVVLWVPGGPDRPYKCPVAFPTEKAKKAEATATVAADSTLPSCCKKK